MQERTDSTIPEPIEDGRGATVVGPRNIELERMVPDIFAGPETDGGLMPNMHFPFAFAHNRLCDGGWSREVTKRELPALSSMAIVNMRLEPGAVRELHWHKEAEWCFVTSGRARLTVVDVDRNAYVDDLDVGDVWLVPAGIPHSIQGLHEGTEFVLVFDDPNFSEFETLLVTEIMAHMPVEVIAKNFGVSKADLQSLPKTEKYIFKLAVPPPLDVVRHQLTQATPAAPFVFHASKVPGSKFDGGSTKIIDERNFPETSISALVINLEPGGMREIHWHPDTDELQYYTKGKARMTVFDAAARSRTFDFQAGDVRCVPRTMGHYIENTGDEPMQVINVFNAKNYKDVSLAQWLALTPREMVQGTLNLNDKAMSAMQRGYRPIRI